MSCELYRSLLPTQLASHFQTFQPSFSGRLTSLRLEQRRVPSDSAQMAREALEHLGIRLGSLIAGRPDIRGQSGYVFHWGEGWFEEVRDGGPGWSLQRDDKSAVDFRVNLLLDIFRHRRRSGLPALMNSMQVAVSDLQGGALDLRQ